MPFMNRFTTTVTGAVTFTGNTLGLSPTSPAPGNNFGTINVFTTVNTSLQVPGFPVGTTNDWRLNSSSAILNLPAGSNVLYAELVWAGTYQTDTEDVTAFLNDNITFRTPVGTFSVTPDPATAQQGSVGSQFYYVRSANVTSLVNAGGAGPYITGGVPATRTSAETSISRSVGWTLEVVYQNASLPLRNLSVYAGQEIIDASSPPVDATISGFATPSTGSVTGRVLVTAQEGDSNIVGDQLRFGPNANATVALFGPRNPANNFFQSQICNDSGNLDTTGTFGNLNQPLGIALAVRRQGWDITNVDASSSLVNNQTSATVRFVTNGDGYAAAGFGVQIDATGPIINPVKSVDKTVAGIGDILTYTIPVPNTGTGSAENVVLQDSIPNGTTFIAGSVTVGGVTQPSANPASGINLGTIPNNAQRVVAFQVRVTSFPNPNPISNRAMVSYQFRPFVGSPPITSTASSNTVQTTVNRANVSLQKSVDLQTAALNDVLTYTVNVTNNGNVAANNVIFVDSIPAGTTFVANSVTVNGVARPGANPASSINIGSINASQTTIVRFQVRVTSNPLVNPIPNRASVTFNFTPVPGQQPVSGQATSNTVFTTINIADIRTRKTVDKAFATVNDVLTYTVTIENTGNVLATNVIFQDPIPTGTTFIANSVTVDGVSQPGANPATGFAVANISPGGSRTVTFQVRVVSAPSGGTVANRGNVSANFIVNPNQPPITINRQTNTVVTQINTGGLNVIKEVNTTQAAVGDTLTYTIAVQNTGNVPLTNVFFQDTTSSAVSFVANSVTINGALQSGLNPNSGFSLPNIPAAQTVVVTFDVLIEQDPPNEDILNSATVSANFQVDPNEPPVTITVPSNVVNTAVQTGSFEVIKSVNTGVAIVGDILVYTVEIINAGSVPATNVFFQDAIPQGTLFIENSVFVNGVLQEGADPEFGFTLNDLPTGESVTVTFEVLIDETPMGNNVVNNANVTGDFLVNPTEPPITVTVPSNTVMTVVNSSGLNVMKSVSATEAGLGDTLTYTVRIQNSGTVAATNVSFLDPIPAGTTFVANSVTINGISQPGLNPTTGFPLANIPVGGMVTVTFQVLITSVPANRVLPNNANVTADFQVSPLQPPITIVTISNIVVTRVNVGSINVMKSVNTPQAGVGDTLTYTIRIQNTGTVPAANIIFQDPIPAGAAFVANSVTINGVVQQGADPAVGFPVSNIPVGQTVTITFQVTVTSVPSGGNIRNQSNVTASFLINPAGPPITTVTNSNFVVTQVNTAQLNIQKSASVQQAALGETYTYSVVIRNNGTVIATNVSFIDTVAPETTFVANSVTINGTSQPGFDPNVGFALPNIAAGTSLTVTFQVTVVAPSTRGAVVNTASATATFLLNPLQPPVTTTNSSNTTVVTIPLPPPGEVTATKTVDVATGAVGDVLTYSVLITNVGIIPVTDVLFQDVIPEGTTFVENSVTIGGIQQLGLNPEIGFTVIPLLNAGGSITVTFQVTITEIPDNEVILNDADVTFTSQPNPQEPPITQTILTNLVVTTINIASIFPLKLVDKEVATVGEILTYDVLIFNFGTVAATNVQFIDTTSSGVTFVPGSVSINGVPEPGLDPFIGFTVPDIPVGDFVLVTYQEMVTSIPEGGTVVNFVDVTATFAVSETEPPITETTTSNTTLTKINESGLNVLKSVSQPIVAVGDTITYTTVVQNTGTVPATNVQYSDVLPSSITFVLNSVTIGGVLQPGFNPNNGFPLPDINPGESVEVTFQVTVVSVPSNGTIANTANATGSFILVPGEPPVVVNQPSNTTLTTVNRGRFNVIKQANRAATLVGDVLTYTVQITNTGTVTANNVQFIDTISAGASFVPNSVTVNGTPQPGLNPITGFGMGDILVGNTTIVTFQATVTTIPSSGTITNVANITGSFTLVPGEPSVVVTEPSNTTITRVNRGRFSVIKTVNKEATRLGDTLTYSVQVINTGTVTAINVQFIDVPSPSLEFVPGSVQINGIPQVGLDPFVGFSLPDLAVGDSIVITFEVNVITVPPSSSIMNTARVTGDFELIPGEPPFTITNSSNTTVTPVNRGSLDMLKEVDNSIVGVGETVTYSVRILNIGTADARNVQFIDVLSPEAVFVPNSVTVNGVARPGVNPQVGFTILDIPVGETAIVTYEATITSFPDGGTVVNVAGALAEYILVPGEPPITVMDTSNTVIVTVNTAILFVAKGADFEVAMVGDVVTYGIAVINDSTVPVTNVVLKDIIDPNTLFINGTVTVNDVPFPFANPNTGILLGDFQPNDAAIINFQVVITGGQMNNLVTNTATANGLTTVNPNQPPVLVEGDSNTVVIPFITPNVSTTVVKRADLQTATIGDVITFTTVITNTGDTTIQNIRFQDMLDSSVRFVPGSVVVDGATVPNVSPAIGFIIGNLNPGEARTVSFQVAVEQAPIGSGNYINTANIRFEYQIGTVLPPVTQIIESNMVVIPFVPTLEQICATNFNCLEKIPFKCSPCNHFRINKK
ncbi:hypothetical protein IEE_01902 [Bacillus cereus BAG5X1-1]|uniref:DUF11 domain-containing protein n=1 Tax=Bacillus cereus BAG5X1-1 TaxID=1053189 RepID=J7XPY8_BACCE|nr:DUF11 domain-containing protein [Bacillus cereus]EJQ46403.1 hypothetical protein IEE_01902 [Bacillus cereus BAG5X1-1]